MENGKIVGEQAVDTNGSGHGALAGFLQAAKVDALICGGIGMGTQMALADAGIRLYAGVQGSADAAAKALAEGTTTRTLAAIITGTTTTATAAMTTVQSITATGIEPWQISHLFRWLPIIEINSYWIIRRHSITAHPAASFPLCLR